MEQLMTPDGVTYIWDTQNDIAELCRKYISDDVANYVYEVLGDIDSENERQRILAESDYSVMEQENEYLRNELDEMSSQLQQISYEADQKPGLSKRAILEKIDGIWTYIQSIL